MLLVWGIARTYATLMYQFVAIKLGKEGNESKEEGLAWMREGEEMEETFSCMA